MDAVCRATDICGDVWKGAAVVFTETCATSDMSRWRRCWGVTLSLSSLSMAPLLLNARRRVVEWLLVVDLLFVV